MAFVPQNFKDGVGPAISAAFLNGLDVTANFVLNGAQTVAAAQAALGIPGGGVPISANGVGTVISGGADAGVVNAYVVPITAGAMGTAAALAVGQLLIFTAANPNTGPSTIAVGGTAATGIIGQFGGALTGGEILAVEPTILRYNGANWQIVNQDSSYVKLLAETNAAAVTVNLRYPLGDLRGRYGLVPNNSTAPVMASNYAILAALFNPAIANGPTGRFYTTNTGGAANPDTYYFSEMAMIRDGAYIDGQYCVWSFGSPGLPIVPVANDTNSGCLTAIRDFRLENIVIAVNGTSNAITSTLNALQFGIRSNGTPRWPIAIFDASLPVPMGNIHLKNVRTIANITSGGAGFSSIGSIALVGGLQNVTMENIVMNGGGNLTQGMTYEFGFATSTVNGGDVSMRQSSHMRGLKIDNITAINFGNSGGAEAGIIMDVPYNVEINNYYFDGVSNGFVTQPGECGNLFPWQPGGTLGNDATGVKHNIKLTNVVGDNFTSSGLSVSGVWAATPGSGYHTNNWSQGEVIIQNQTVLPAPAAWLPGHIYAAGSRVLNTAGGTQTPRLYFTVTGGTSAGAGNGPSGTGSHLTGNAIVDNTVTWDFYPWQLFQAQNGGVTLGAGQGPFLPYGTAAPLTFADNGITWLMLSPQCFTDLMDMEIAGLALNGSAASFGISCQLGRMQLRNYTITGCQRGVAISDETTQVDLDGFRIIGMQQHGIELDTNSGVDIFNPPRLKKIRIANGKIAGCSASAAGVFPGISVAWSDGLVIEKMQFGHEIRYDYQDELTQGPGINLININAPVSNAKISACRFGGAVGGTAISTANALGNNTLGNTYEQCSFNTAGSGLALLPLTNPISGTLTTAVSGAWEPILLGPSADRGDNSVNVFAHTDFQQQIFNTPLSVNRTVTLGVSGAVQGDKFRVVRTTAATGASTLSVIGSPTRVLTVGQWTEYTFNMNTAAWTETAGGTL
jgi:hypothetical protein